MHQDPFNNNNSIWLPNGSGSLSNGEMRYDNSNRIDQKRGHHWFMDTSEQELFSNKKQAIESNNKTSGPALMGGSLSHGGSSSQSEGQRVEGQRVDQLYGRMPVQSPIVSAPVNTVSEYQFQNNPSICLTKSHNIAEDPLSLNRGPRKVIVNEVTASENRLPQLASNNNTFFSEQKNKVTSSCFPRVTNSLFPGLYNYTLDGNKFSGGQASDKTGGNFMHINNYYNGINNNMLSIGQTSNRGNSNINSDLDHYRKENGNFMSTGPNYNKGHDNNNYFPFNSFCNKVNETFMPAYNKGDTQQDANVLVPYTEEDPSVSLVVENSKKGGENTNTISFGNLEQRDLISSYNVVPVASGQNDSSAVQRSANVVPAATSKADGEKKIKEPKSKKASTNNFPSNVKSLLSTGIFDGVPVKYKNLRGVVKGTGYLCSCKDCNLSKIANAYEFECHANCKTKHPNNHIYFENGKTIYAVVQELKSTPQEMLFEVIQNVTGSAINQKNFITWKGSFKAATRELQRIYGKDDIAVAS
ncbi:hypothetical protein CASFOL_010866 [Castilleja foliolosa]|uniref:Tify domain-containing protein n=1 Tax=Castilleja foliolosa TaxID=1961234 RepID=A0ABD3DY00_9LAMI